MGVNSPKRGGNKWRAINKVRSIASSEVVKGVGVNCFEVSGKK